MSVYVCMCMYVGPYRRAIQNGEGTEGIGEGTRLERGEGGGTDFFCLPLVLSRGLGGRGFFAACQP